MHDEISGWVSTDGIEMPGILEKRWMKYDDSEKGKEAVWIDEKGIEQKARKGGNIDIKTILEDHYITLLPEYYLRPYSPHYIDEKEFKEEIQSIEDEIRRLFK